MGQIALVVVPFLIGLLVFFLSRRVERHLKQYKHLDADGIRECLSMLIEHGADGAFVIFDDMASTRFVQFRLEATEKHAASLQSDFPCSPWSAAHYEGVRQHAEPLATVSEQPGGGAVEKFLHVDFGLNVNNAVEFATGIFVDVFGCVRVDVSARSSGLTRMSGRLPPPLTPAAAWGHVLGRAVGEGWHYLRTAGGMFREA